MEKANTEQGNPQKKSGLTSEGNQRNTLEPEPKLYSESEFKKRLSDELTKAGRDAKGLEARENVIATRGKEIEEKEAKIGDAEARIKELEADLEKLSSGDPDKSEVVALRKELKTERAKLAQEQKDYGERIKKAEDHEKEVNRNTLMGEIAGEFESGDTEELRAECDKLGIPDEAEKVRVVAGHLWKKITKPLVTEADKGSGSGGGVDLNQLSARQLARLAYSKKN